MKEIDFCQQGRRLRGHITSTLGQLAQQARLGNRRGVLDKKARWVAAKESFALHCVDCDPCKEAFDAEEDRRHALRVQAIEENKTARFPVTVTKIK